LAKYGHSPSEVIMSCFPNHEWHPWKFERTPKHWWKRIAQNFKLGDANAIRMVAVYIDELACIHGVSKRSDWARISRSQLGYMNERRLLILGGLQATLQALQTHYTSMAHDEHARVFDGIRPDIFLDNRSSQYDRKAVVQNSLIDTVTNLLPTQNVQQHE